MGGNGTFYDASGAGWTTWAWIGWDADYRQMFLWAGWQPGWRLDGALLVPLAALHCPPDLTMCGPLKWPKSPFSRVLCGHHALSYKPIKASFNRKLFRERAMWLLQQGFRDALSSKNDLLQQDLVRALPSILPIFTQCWLALNGFVARR